MSKKTALTMEELNYQWKTAGNNAEVISRSQKTKRILTIIETFSQKGGGAAEWRKNKL